MQSDSAASTTSTITIDLGDRSYPILLGSGLLNQIPAVPANWLGTGLVLIISDNNVAPLYLQPLIESLRHNKPDHQIYSQVLPAGEGQKCVATWESIHHKLTAIGAQRDATIVALGGGVVGDLAGFAAATYMRGVGFVQVPTSLLAQVDSSVGGKTGINLPAGKNLLGAFYQPQGVLIDLETLKTLPDRELRAGLAEVIKYGLIGDAAFISWLEDNLQAALQLQSDVLAYAVGVSVKHKAEVVRRDEREQGPRALLNLGHTFGHAIEASAGYGDVLHGEAVSIGMVCAAHLSQILGDLSVADQQRVTRLLKDAGLPVTLPTGSSAKALLDLMALDKKNQAGRLRLVLLNALGDARLRDDIAPSMVIRTLESLH
ncbi:MAG: 3-dehydroquinate synthase [Lysobacterales bacterium]